MAIRVYKPTTAGRRNASVSDFSELTRSTPEKSLVRKLSKTGGRSSCGRMTSVIGGECNAVPSRIDFGRTLKDKDGVRSLTSSTTRTVPLASHCCATQMVRSVTSSLPEGIKQGDVIETGARLMASRATTCRCATSRLVPWCTRLSSARWVAPRSLVPQVLPCSSSPSGAYAQLSPWRNRNVDARCRATVGEVGNSDHANIQLGKAGRARWMGKRPITRGESMNPVDHPHGGRTRGGCRIGFTVNLGEFVHRPKKASNKMIVRRRPNGKNRK